ncbi:hypothetical protein ACEQ8H_008234 [Pleosporales sp. CAS-2024a]
MKFSAAVGVVVAAVAASVAARPSTTQMLAAQRIHSRQNGNRLGSSGPVRPSRNNAASDAMPDSVLDTSNVKKNVDKNVTINYSENWAGIQLNPPPSGTYYTSATGRISMPYPHHVGSDGDEFGSMWVGIDGICDGGFIQGGVMFSVSPSGQVGWSAWHQFWPDNATIIPDQDLTVNSGDLVQVDITASSTTKGTVKITNLSTHKSYSKTLIAPKGNPLCRQNAEWIVENFDWNGEPGAFGNFSTVLFSRASAHLNTGVTKDLDSPYNIWTMTRSVDNGPHGVLITDVKKKDCSSLTVQYLGLPKKKH